MIASSCVAAAADPFLHGALETTVPTFCHMAPRQQGKASRVPTHCSELLSLLAWAVTHFLQLQTLSDSLTGSALALSHGWGSFFLTHGPCFAPSQSQNSKFPPFYSLPLLVSKQLLPKSSFFSSATNRASFFNYSNWIPILLDQILLLLSRASPSYITVLGLNMETLNFSITAFKTLNHIWKILPLLSLSPFI